MSQQDLTMRSCHCLACCNCSTRDRLLGRCEAHSKLYNSSASLDRGLSVTKKANLQVCDRLHSDLDTLQREENPKFSSMNIHEGSSLLKYHASLIESWEKTEQNINSHLLSLRNGSHRHTKTNSLPNHKRRSPFSQRAFPTSSSIAMSQLPSKRSFYNIGDNKYTLTLPELATHPSSTTDYGLSESCESDEASDFNKSESCLSSVKSSGSLHHGFDLKNCLDKPQVLTDKLSNQSINKVPTKTVSSSHFSSFDKLESSANTVVGPLLEKPNCDLFSSINLTSSDVSSKLPILNCADAISSSNNGLIFSTNLQQPRIPHNFQNSLRVIKSLYKEFTDEQKNIVLREIIESSNQPQLHMLSCLMQDRLHVGCHENCQDILSWLPTHLALNLLEYLDPVSLCHSSAVCRTWRNLATTSSLWKKICFQLKWRLSPPNETKQILSHVGNDNQINWKSVFGERFRLRCNWLNGRCQVRTFEGHTQGVSCIQFDETRIVSGSSDKSIRVWDIRSNTSWSAQTLLGHSGTVRCLHLEGNRLVSGSTDCSIKVWDLSSESSWSSIACRVTMVGHADTVRCLRVDGEKVVSGSYDKTLKIWCLKTGTCLLTLRGHEAAVLCVQFDKSKIVSGSCDKTIKVWTFEGECVRTLCGHGDAVTCLQFNDICMVSGSLDYNLKFWCLRSGRCLQTIDWKDSEGHTGVVRCLQADGWRVVSASDDRTLKVWSLENGKRLVTLREHSDGVTCLQFNDHMIVSGSYDKTVKLWDFSCR